MLFVRQTFLSVCFYASHLFVLSAQQGIGAHRFDQVIVRFAETGRKDSFLYYTGQKLALAKQNDDLALWGWTQLDIHDFFSNDNEKALSCLNAAWSGRWREPSGAQEWEPFLYIQANRGWFLFRLEKVWQAAQAYEDAARIYERYRYPDFEAVDMIYKPLGNHYTRLGDNEKALAVFQKALLIGGDDETMAGLYNNIGVALWNRGDYAGAIPGFRQGLSLKNISGPKKALLLFGLARVMLDSGETKQAHDLAARALVFLRGPATDNAPVQQYRAYSLHVLGLASAALGLYPEAERSLREALREARAAWGNTSRDVGKIEIARSGLYRRQGRYADAMDAANRALSAVIPRFKPLKTADNPPVSAFYEENTIAEALEAKGAAAALLFEKNGDLSLPALALSCYDLAWQAEAGLRQVFQYSSSKLNLQKNARSREEAAMQVARLLYEKTGRAEYLEKAFAIAERSKAALLLDALQDNLVQQRLSGTDARFGEITRLRQNFALFERNMILEPGNASYARWRLEADALGARIAALERALDADYPGLRAFRTAPEPPLPDLQDLQENEALAEYFAGERFIEVFVFQKSRAPVWQRLPNDAALTSLYREFLAFFADADAILGDPAKYLATAHALWEKIVPAAAAGAKKLVVVPDGFLNFIPFEALVTARPGAGSTLRNAAYAIRGQEVRYAWSLAVWKKQHALKSTAAKGLLAFAPGFARGERGLAPLRPGKEEWQSAGNGNTDVLEAADASLKNYLQEAGRYRVLHFSTHAFADAAPRIELYDQSMLLPDIYATPLHADLVVLSACQTGLGKEQKGEGVMSLARAFAHAGAACTVSSLWAVNDKCTAQLLDRFYGQLRAGQPLGGALREAKLRYLDDAGVGAAFQTPYFWAGFTAVGDDRKISVPGAAGPAPWVAGGLFLIGFIFILHQYFASGRHLQGKNRSKKGNSI